MVFLNVCTSKREIQPNHCFTRLTISISNFCGKCLGYILLRYSSAKFVQTDRDDHLI